MKERLTILLKHRVLMLSLCVLWFNITQSVYAQVTLEKEVKITDKALYFDGVKNQNSTNDDPNSAYDYAYGNSINPHGDCIKTYKEYVFMTWYQGGKDNRHVMLTRYNTSTGSIKTIEFPHRHTGLSGKWWIGETHNTIAIGISPINGTIHLAYDMHAYSNSGNFVNDYFRYSYSEENVAELTDDEFTLDKFVKDPIDGDYRHCTMSGVRNASNFSKMTYPKFFLNTEGELFLCMRKGTSHDGAMMYIKYDDSENKWGLFEGVTALGAQSKGETHDWSIYGNMKFAGGKMRLGFQRRLRNGSDKFQYQNGVYYAYSDDPTGASLWKNYKGEPMTLPLVKAEEVLIFEPGDYVETTQQNMVHIVGGFDFEVTDRGDEHIVSQVKDKQFNVTKKLHTYRKAGDSEFTTVEYNAGSELYTSGNDIYVIGLKNGRVNIVKTQGGTSNFQEVYQHTTGPTFDKGIVHVSDGKLYYYLKENGGSGDQRTTYLQVFDLDIKPFNVGLTYPLDKTTHILGQSVTLSAEISGTADIEKVDFKANGTLLKSVTTSPYTTEWTPTQQGDYTIEAVAFDKQGEEVLSPSVGITVSDPKYVLSFKELIDNQEIPLGSDLDVEAEVGNGYKEVTLFVNDVNVGTLSEAPFIWLSSLIEALRNLTEAEYILKLVALDDQDNSVEHSIKITTPQLIQWAYTDDNQPHTIPGKIEFEHYDHGGFDIAYWDKVNQNSSSFRPNEMVDISSDGTKVRDIKTDEWLEYTINVTEPGEYELLVNHQSRRSPEVEQLTVSFPDENITFISNKQLTYTGNGPFITEKAGSFYLEKGDHVLRFTFLQFGFDVDFFELNKIGGGYLVTFNDGTNTVTTYSKEDGTCDLPENPTREGYEFNRWVTVDGEVFDENTVVTEDIEVHAVWSRANKLDLIYNRDHGTVDVSWDTNGNIVLTAEPNEGYTFEGWSGDHDGTENPAVIPSGKDYTITVVFKEVDNAVTSIDLFEKGVNVYPNPSNGIINIELPEVEQAAYKVFDTDGRLITQGKFINKITLEIPSKKRGIYFLEIITEHGVATKKIIIK
ncbi:BNR-4 repeat-containing protein [Flammeovirga yaeyamensis]|uniref:BNR-4 repeat-containing protein n=1 Tax=Flammeovirga yaeyamensis TaxID=367791 RepID=A0AAX1NG21_9BACT|nr:BNR-4 repeat-containing protein [Flammeovirga yaeyamensis]MBB3696625.1 putative repeat protein (TIGR02543 family) [Flammeovirga yaeyamensis]NMF33298.1 T9SS type A sorting domain-containing protein [Flammeovirga yaeyamensis]QWG05423.1 BNR-4 repeat-containing protein [Flammeovirga yaeyamensis]